jgi:adenine/guanine phosphoribosyltransferase-like PRPP-binding protein
MRPDDTIQPTSGFWQTLRPAGAAVPPPYQASFPARLPDGRILDLPIRRLPGEPPRAVASLIANHASFAVVRALAGFMTELARQEAPDIIVGLPTLGFAFAPLMAEALGHPNFAPCGYSRKFWYDEALSEPVSSLTTPGMAKRLYLDPHLLPRLAGRRAIIVDDAISSGRTALAALRLVTRLNVTVAAVIVAMKQGRNWHASLASGHPAWPDLVRGVFDSPLLRWTDVGWMPEPDDAPVRPSAEDRRR